VNIIVVRFFKLCSNPIPSLNLSLSTGNDFLPHLPSLDIRDGGLDFLFNVYKRVLPTLGDYITNHGGEVNLSHVDVILAEVGAIEDHVFGMKHQNEENDKKRKEQFNQRKKHLTKNGQAPLANHPGAGAGGKEVGEVPKVRGRAARILEQNEDMTALGKNGDASSKHKSLSENARVAEELKASLMKGEADPDTSTKRKVDEISPDDNDEPKEEDVPVEEEEEEEFDQEAHDLAVVKAKNLLKQKMKDVEQKKLNDFAANVDDKVRLHEKGWKVSRIQIENDIVALQIQWFHLITNIIHPRFIFRTATILTSVKQMTLKKMEVGNIYSNRTSWVYAG